MAAGSAEATREDLAARPGGILGFSASGLRGASPQAATDPSVAADRPAPSAAKRTALIIGINRARGGKPLPGSIADARNMRDALVGYGFKPSNITLLLDGQASAGAIRHHLDLLARRTPADGLAVFAVATHTRRHGGQNELLTGDGARIGANELAARLARVRSPMWVALPTCYAGGYAKKGIVGPNRIATFASPSNQETYQLGKAGSHLIINMVRKAMLEGRAPGSVEDAFRYAETTLRREFPNRVPIMSDGVEGDLVLGRVPARFASADAPAQQGEAPSRREIKTTARTYDHEGESGNASQPSSSPEEGGGSSGGRGNVGVCGRFRYNCAGDR